LDGANSKGQDVGGRSLLGWFLGAAKGLEYIMGTRMAGKIALISGSTRGIGRSMAELFASEGAKVAVTGRTEDRGQKVVARIKELGGEAEFFKLDVNDENSVRSVVAATVERFGGLTTLINNAAPTDAVATTVKPLAEYSTEEWNHILLGTLTGNVFWASKYAWPHLQTAEGAAIVNISSGQSLAGFTGFSAYAAAKGAMNSTTRVLAVEGRVVSGRSDSGVGIGLTGGRLTRIGNPMDIAYTAVFLASDESAFITGELLTADGGAGINGDISMNA
jgi:meso-butanediol dehydrogenase / (S,S)-butanediol dehydrogenase / diacetyl reductase